MKFEIELGEFYSQGDERRFFEGLSGIRGVTKVVGVGTKLGLQINAGKLNSEAVFDLIGLCRRYGIPLAPLSALTGSKKLQWVGQPHWYWHSAMFGADDTSRTGSRNGGQPPIC